MSVGLVALLDDIAGMAKLAAASLDDIAGHAAKATAKSAGVVIDDTAVTPRYVVGFTPDRELPIIWRIALGSIRNKVLILLPMAIGLSALAPWAITPLLMFGGLFLCYEGAEKVYEALFPHAAHEHEHEIGIEFEDLATLEEQKVNGAIRTDFILSAEIMAIALASLPASDLLTQFVSLLIVALAITAGVYGVVALIVRADDIGVALARRNNAGLQWLGRGIVVMMPKVLTMLAVVGTAAMIWVGGGIVLHAHGPLVAVVEPAPVVVLDLARFPELLGRFDHGAAARAVGHAVGLGRPWHALLRRVGAVLLCEQALTGCGTRGRAHGRGRAAGG